MVNWAAQFLGVLIGSVLKSAGPEIGGILRDAIRDALSDTAEIAKPNADLNNMWRDPATPSDGVRDETRSPR
jgi:hypothetical protein